MYMESVENVAAIAEKKAKFAKSPVPYLISSALAGAYVGVGIALIASIGAPLAFGSSPLIKLIMGLSFGIALTLVVFAGSELFTGNNMYMTMGVVQKKVGLKSLLSVWGLSWIGNLIGSVFFAFIVIQSGSINHAAPLIEKLASAKMSMDPLQMVLRGVLCNWLVCLALWMAGRTKSEAAKCILIFWCLFAFIACGYEHSVANMTLLSMSLFLPHGADITVGGLVSNLFFVTIGNIIGGAGLVALLYWFACDKKGGGNV